MRPSRSLLINAIGVVVLVAALVLVGRLGPGNQGAQPATGSTQRPVSLPDHPTTTIPSPVVAKISVADRPVDAVATSPGAVWAASGCTVLRVGPTINLVVATVAGTGRANRCVLGLAAGAGAVWGTVPGVGVVRIDPQANRVVAMVPVGPTGESIAVGAGGVWVGVLRGWSHAWPWAAQPHRPGNQPGDGDHPDAGPAGCGRGGPQRRVGAGRWRADLARRPGQQPGGGHDPGAGRLGGNRGSVAVTSQAVWVSDPANDTLLQLDPQRDRVVVSWEAAGGAVAVAGEVVWTAGDGGLVGAGRGGVRAVQAPEISAREVTGLAVGSGGL
jgi:hypothetical protein